MADISYEITQLRDAIYGKEVRAAFISCIDKINDDNEAYKDIKREIDEKADFVNNTTRQVENLVKEVKEVSMNQPVIKNLTWWIWDNEKHEYVDTGEVAGVGLPKCIVDDTGNLYIANFSATEVDFELDSAGYLYYGKKVAQ